MTTYYTYKDMPGGVMLLIKEGDILKGLHWKAFRRTPLPSAAWVQDASAFADVLLQLEEYYAGARETFDIAYQLEGTPFQQSVWKALEGIPYGVPSSYGAVAAMISKPRAVRAVGTAIGSNPICIIVPCHRVLTSDGRVGGYAGGLPAKRALLDIEKISVKS